jgi:hypothetical protein
LFATVVRVMRSIIANLMPASGHQNHTTSPSASRAFVLPRQSVHRIPHPTFVTIAKRPSNGCGTAWDIEVIWRRRERIYFFKRDWTGSISMIRFRKLAFRRKSDQPDGSASAAPLALNLDPTRSCVTAPASAGAAPTETLVRAAIEPRPAAKVQAVAARWGQRLAAMEQQLLPARADMAAACAAARRPAVAEPMPAWPAHSVRQPCSPRPCSRQPWQCRGISAAGSP